MGRRSFSASPDPGVAKQRIIFQSRNIWRILSFPKLHASLYAGVRSWDERSPWLVQFIQVHSWQGEDIRSILWRAFGMTAPTPSPVPRHVLPLPPTPNRHDLGDAISFRPEAATSGRETSLRRQLTRKRNSRPRGAGGLPPDTERPRPLCRARTADRRTRRSRARH